MKGMLAVFVLTLLPCWSVEVNSILCSEFTQGNCGIGEMKLINGLECSCLPCPPGTYKVSNDQELCKLCDEQGKFCPISSELPQNATQCTYWIPSPSQTSLTASSEYNNSNPYKFYTEIGANVNTSSGELIPYSALVSDELWVVERYGFLSSLRNAQIDCGQLHINDSSLSGSAIKPGELNKGIRLTNTGSLPINVSIDILSFTSIMIVPDLSFLADDQIIVIDPGLFVDVELTVHTSRIPDSAIGSFSFNLSITSSQYWLASTISSSSVSNITVNVTLTQGSLIYSPLDIVVLQEGSTFFQRNISVFNVFASAQTWALQSIRFNPQDQTSWLQSGFQANGGSMSSSCQCSISVTPGQCETTTPSSGSFVGVSSWSLNSTGLRAGDYKAVIRYSAELGGVFSIPVLFSVLPEEVDDTKTSWKFDSSINLAKIVAKDFLEFEIFPRDRSGVSSLRFPGEVQPISVSYNVTVQKLPSGATQVIVVNFFNGRFQGSFVVPESGNYSINITRASFHIKDSPFSPLTVSAVDCEPFDKNSKPNEIGDSCVCKPGFKASGNFGTFVTCKPCDRGFFELNSDCEECPSGQYQPETGKTSCINCTDNTTEPSASRDMCVPCLPGHVVGSISKICEPCSENSVARPGDATCTLCPDGTIANEDSSACIFCGNGEFRVGTACQPCAPGNYSAPAQNIVNCTRCPPGTEPSLDRSFCQSCAPGHVVNNATGFCEPCLGKLIAAPGDLVCSACPSTLEPNDEKSGCRVCSGGSVVSPTTGFCERCNLGEIAAPGDSVCSPCPQFLGPNQDSSLCVPCPPGEIVDPLGEGSPFCAKCPRGTIAKNNQCQRCESFLETPDDAQDKCVPCPRNRYIRRNDTSSICFPCPLDRILRPNPDVDESSEFFICDCSHQFVKSFGSNGEFFCKPCPEGALCSGRTEGNLLPLDGYCEIPWNNSQFVKSDSCPGVKVLDKADLLNLVRVEELVQEYYAQFTAKALKCEGLQKCEVGYVGPGCFKCDVGYIKTGEGSCNKCIDRGLMIGLICGGLIVVFAVTVLLIRRTIRSLVHISNEVLFWKILATHLQIAALLGSIDLEWPGYMMSFYSVLDLLSSAGQTLMSFDCLIEPGIIVDDCPSQNNITDLSTIELGVFDSTRSPSFFYEAVFIALVPVLWLIGSALFWYAAYKRWQKIHFKNKGRSFFRFFIVTNIVLLFLLYPSLTRASFKLFACSEVSFAGVSFLAADFNIVCFGGYHMVWALTLGILMLLIYALGVPFGSFIILRRRGAAVDSKVQTRNDIYSIAIHGFKKNFQYWESVIMTRKLAIAFIAVILRLYGRKYQGYISLLVLVASMLIHNSVFPYEELKPNLLELASLSTLCLTVFLGLLNSSATVDRAARSRFALEIVVIMMHASFFLVCSYSIFREIRNSRESPEQAAMAAASGDAGGIDRPRSQSPARVASTSSADNRGLQDFFESRQKTPVSANLVKKYEREISKRLQNIKGMNRSNSDFSSAAMTENSSRENSIRNLRADTDASITAPPSDTRRDPTVRGTLLKQMTAFNSYRNPMAIKGASFANRSAQTSPVSESGSSSPRISRPKSTNLKNIQEVTKSAHGYENES